MTIQELISLDKHKVRRDSSLMHLYIQFFKETFNYLPTCTGCSFDSDWNKLRLFHSKNNSATQIKKNMSNNITIKKKLGKILTYYKDGRAYRLYDNNLNDDFINEYVSNGTPDEIEQRKKLFNFPEVKKEKITEAKPKPKAKAKK
jgi:hypothetical protein